MKKEMKNKMFYWKGVAVKCKNCGCKQFYIDKEEHIPPKESVFTPAPHQRLVLICKKCGQRQYPEDCTK